MKRLVLVLLAATFWACGGELGAVIGRENVKSAAAADYNCPRDRIKVIHEDTTSWTYDLLVCGTARRYRDVGGQKSWRFIEIADAGRSDGGID